MELADFLLARIAEDEAAWSGGLGLVTRPDFSKLSRHMLADCEAKRRIVNAWLLAESYMGSEANDGMFYGLDKALRLLALPYAGHPDYREDWRP